MAGGRAPFFPQGSFLPLLNIHFLPFFCLLFLGPWPSPTCLWYLSRGGPRLGLITWTPALDRGGPSPHHRRARCFPLEPSPVLGLPLCLGCPVDALRSEVHSYFKRQDRFPHPAPCSPCQAVPPPQAVPPAPPLRALQCAPCPSALLLPGHPRFSIAPCPQRKWTLTTWPKTSSSLARGSVTDPPSEDGSPSPAPPDNTGGTFVFSWSA